MSSGCIYICLVPSTWWVNHGATSLQTDFANIAREAIEIERRLPKRVDLERNLNRYTICCERMAALIKSSYEVVVDLDTCRKLLQAGHIAAMSLDASYLALLNDRIVALNHDQIVVPERVGAMFFPPSEVVNTSTLAQHRQELADLMQDEVNSPPVAQRLALIDLAISEHCGIIEFYDLYDGAAMDLNQAASAPSAMYSAPEIIIQQTSNETDDAAETNFDDDGRRHSQHELMRAEVKRGLLTGQVVNFNNYSNHVISDVLREFAYRTAAADQPKPIKVVYGDGSQARPISLFSLPTPSQMYLGEFERCVPLRIALLSIRHVEMDSEVDMAWFRNSAASLRRMSSADTDEFCYVETIRQLEELDVSETLLIHLYQTGLEPAVVGFYRGLIAYLSRDKRQRANVAIVPRYFRGAQTQYRSGQMWA